jgi:hypothetical protein
MYKKGISELEQEFELVQTNSNEELSHEEGLENDEYGYEMSDDDIQSESDEDLYEGEIIESADDEFEEDNEWNDEFEEDNAEDDELEDLSTDDEFETDYALWSRDGKYDRDREFEHRLLEVLQSDSENELEFEMKIDSILHEMEQEYFFGAAKKWLKKKGIKYLKKYAANAIPMVGALKAISSLGRLNIRNLLKNKLLQQAAQFIPGAGPLVSKAMSVAGGLLNKPDSVKEKIKDIVEVGKEAYQNLATDIPEAQNEVDVRRASTAAIKRAIVNVNSRKNTIASASFSKKRVNQNRKKMVYPLNPGSRVAIFPDRVSINKRKQVIPLKRDSIVIVESNKLIIWESK